MKLLGHHLFLQAGFLVAWDIGTILGAVYVGSFTPALGLPSLWLDMDPIWPKAVAFLAISIGTLFLADLYQLDPSLGKKECFGRVLVTFGGIALLYGAVGFLFPFLRLGRGVYLLALLLSLPTVAAGRFLALALGSTSGLQHRVLLLGATPLADRLIEAMDRVRDHGYEVSALTNRLNERGSRGSLTPFFENEPNLGMQTPCPQRPGGLRPGGLRPGGF